ncbi:phenylalanine--tRNA ligase, beta subunit [Leptospira fainei serovar Hurstbridge str. BUT 6]|uniref:Phenylalanine--tRNA ligase beta subunit n=1 Tax=Leptospira fainei serovar Hurstbridge str. BUT 6 TaxID=1193011 RepID=S3USA1_9LEPT|nr:phenylalanine--tRNA ligase subunit beta [Leptospira fainei]EPG73286.1 phenylalanine--tRNA ligase, beta subunit [Leptospira fainei serovar Hurstbridge str. BUT 6]
MKLSLDWMNDYAPLKEVPLEEILKKIAASICEIDGVEDFFPHLEKIVLVRIESLEKHPQADKLQLAIVADGKSKIQIVSGATNLRVGDLVPLAVPGAILDGKEIKDSELRGVKSSGMLCSEKELGLSEEDSGVMVLSDPTAKPGDNLREFLGFRDKIFDVDNKSITHRPDLWSHFGFARELAAQLGLPIKFNPLEQEWEFTKEVSSPKVKETKYAHSYFSVGIEGISIVPSKKLIQARLKKCGIRAINNVVDVSNYLLLEAGQPTHFFDRDKLQGQGEVALEVDYAKAKESFPLLDETSPELDPEILIIRNSGKAVAIAGVMGGAETAVSASTKSLILESAVFPREFVRKSIRKTGIRSESSVRYEKGLEATTSLPVIKRALQLLRENGCETVRASVPVGYIHTADKKVNITLNLDFLNKKLGTDIDRNTADTVLKKLSFATDWDGEKAVVTVPKYRHNYDITLPEDLTEEIGRSLGYASIPRRPLTSEVKPPARNLARELERMLKKQFSQVLGYNEVFNYSYASESDNSVEEESKNFVRIKNAMPDDQAFLRTSLYPSLLKNIRLNADRFENVRIFEFGRTYKKAAEPLNESKWFAWAVSEGRKWNEKDLGQLESDFLQVRSGIEKVLRNLNIRSYIWKSEEKPFFHPKASISLLIDGEKIGELGYVHPVLLDKMDLKKRTILGKFDFGTLLSVWESKRQTNYFKVPSHFPQTEIDLSLVMNASESTSNFAELVRKESFPELEDLRVTVVFRGGNLSDDQKSVSYRFRLLSQDKNLTQERIKEITDRLIDIAKSAGYPLR